jgi:hypothetical protein
MSTTAVEPYPYLDHLRSRRLYGYAGIQHLQWFHGMFHGHTQ